ncbi:carbohydrate ABC transporter permease [Amycolatopsis alkalitolerans]|uniref:Carbohydrate ABC transporter permease n=1 Tax=Amycolatopsis alkalitolerans TaxID=2547244 RepID=A0A5C4M8L5_9PSEU|nr:carbohydrate ABC transporter permease [Amycolatopsis alkalitolerans]TNC29446.1 carbohydrate ABC transporter permease [Amycolatopsis alkalitolerans]
MPEPRRSARGAIGVLAEFVLIAAVTATLAPILWMLVLSFQPLKDIIGSGVRIGFSLSNFTDLLAPGNPLLAQLVNSLLIVVGTVLLCLVFGSLAGYALSQLPLPRWATVPLLILAGFLPLVPPMVLVPGLYATMTSLGLIGGTLGLIVLNTVFQLPFAALLMKVYFDGVPSTLREAALIDGASEAATFRTIMLPLVKPGLAAVGTFTGIMAWNEFLFALTMTSGGVTAPLTVGIASLVQPYEVAWGQMAAAGTLAAVPIILITVVANRYLVAGLTAGAVKG